MQGRALLLVVPNLRAVMMLFFVVFTLLTICIGHTEGNCMTPDSLLVPSGHSPTGGAQFTSGIDIYIIVLPFLFVKPIFNFRLVIG